MIRKSIWLLFAFMSVLILLSSTFFMAFPEITFDISMEYPSSALRWEDLDDDSQIGMRFLIWRPFWDEIIFGLLGLFCAWGLKQKEPFAWKLGVVWGVIMFVAGIALGVSELYIGQWTTICVVTVLYTGIGLIALWSLYFKRKDFAPF